MLKFFQVIILGAFLVHSAWAFSPMENNRKISLDLQNVPLPDALHILAKFMHLNVVIGPAITGPVSIHLQQVPAASALQSLLASHNLSQWRVNQVWFIGTHAEFLQHQQEQLSLQKMQDETAPLVIRLWQIHYAKAEDISRVLQDHEYSLLSKRGQVRVDPRTNIICIHDIQTQMNEIDHLINRLDVPVRQVLIEVRLASIDNDYQRQLGIQFTTQSPTENPTPSSIPPQNGVTIAKLANGMLLDMQLSALETEGHGELISSPRLFTASQQTAFIEAGEEIPYQEISKSGATGISFKKAVLSLRVTPQVMPGGKVLLQLQVNQDKPSNRIVLGVPAISTRQISTHILIKSGQTLVLGGIYETNKEQEEHRLPFLGRIPIVGWLFRQQNIANNKRQLLIFVTPKIIN